VTLQEEYDELLDGFNHGFVKLPPGTKNCGEDVSGMWALAMCFPRTIQSLFCRRMMWLERELNLKPVQPRSDSAGQLRIQEFVASKLLLLSTDHGVPATLLLPRDAEPV
jgi:hypothetical protein